MNRHDLVITRSSGDSVGYMAHWGEASPIRILSEPPELPVSTSTSVAEAGGAFSGRDAAPPYPIEVNDWQGGAGQLSYDKPEASAIAYRDSRNVDVSDAGHFELGPRPFFFPDTGMENSVIHAGGTFWAGINDRPSWLTRYVLTPDGAGRVLSGTGDLVLDVLDATAIPDLAGGAIPAPTVIAGDHLYCPAHNEVVLVGSRATNAVTVTRAQCGTTAAAHDAACRWYGFGWRPVTMPGVGAPTGALTCLTSDGARVYAGFYTPGSPNDSIWAGTFTGEWVEVGIASVEYVVDMVYSNGFLYAAQDGIASKAQVSVINSGGTVSVLTAAGGIAPNTRTAGLCALGVFVYWAVTDGSHTWLYRLQKSTTDVFELVMRMPGGFVATSLVDHLGSLYVGGYTDTLTTDPDNTTKDGQYTGYVYQISGGESAFVVCRFIDAAHDYRVRGLVSAGPHLYIATGEDIRIHNPAKAAWWHACDLVSSSSTVTGSALDFIAGGFSYIVDAKLPSAADAVRSTNVVLDANADGWVDTVAVDNATSPGFISRFDTDSSGAKNLYMEVSAKKWRRYTIAGLPTTDRGTLEFRFAEPWSQGGAFVLAGSTKEVRVYVRGYSVAGGARKAVVGLRYCSDGGASYYGVKWTGAIDVHEPGTTKYVPITVRVTLDATHGAKVYVNGALALTGATNELLTISGGAASKVWFAVGWPGDAQDDSNSERIRLYRVGFTAAGAYPPDYAPITTTVGMKGIAFGDGRVLVPAPGAGAVYADSKENPGSGWLRTSDSAFHMATVEKYFSSVEVTHSRLWEGQRLIVTPYVDGTIAASTTREGPSEQTVTSAPVATAGKIISVQVRLEDDENWRAWADRLRIFSITARFYPQNKLPQHLFILNCRNGVQTRNGHDWGTDPEDAIRHLFACAESGEVVAAKAMWGEYPARIEHVELGQGPADKPGAEDVCGTVTLKMRRVG